MFAGVDAELRDLFGVGRDRDEMLGRWPARRRARASVHRRAVCALVIVSSVVNVLDETMNRVSAGSRSRVASAKSVPSTFETKRKRQVARAVVPQRLVRHDRTEIRAADSDVDHVADRACPCARASAPSADPVGERGHPIEHLVNLRHDVVAIDDDRLAARRAQRHMQHRALFGRC